MIEDLIEIRSEYISAKLSPLGAELKSLFDLENGQEYLWQADPAFWARSAPHLFPIVGKLKDDKFRIGRKFYGMPQHGFARDSKFDVVQAQRDEVTFRLGYNSETLKLYPYKFLLEVTYRCYGPKLFVEYRVFNVDKQEIYFSLGFHPAFNIPIQNGTLEDYYIEFEEREPVGAFFLTQGLVNFEHKDDKTVFDGRRISLNEKLFEHGALVFKDLISGRVALKNKIDAREVILDIDDAPYLGIWRPEGAPFVCVEPWFGVSDGVFGDYDFLKKEGLNELEPSESFKASFVLHVN